MNNSDFIDNMVDMHAKANYIRAVYSPSSCKSHSYTLAELVSRLRVLPAGYGTYSVTFDRGMYYSKGITHNSLAYDRLSLDIPDRSSRFGYTLKQAYLALLSCVVMDRKFKYPYIR